MALGNIGKIIPKEWSTPFLVDLVNPKQWKTISTKDLLDEGYVVYGANGKIGFYNQYTHEAPTIMITCRGATCGNLHISEPYSYINGNAMALDEQPKEFIGIKYLYYALAARGLNDTISGSAQPQITQQGLSEVKIPLPSVAEQKEIVDLLDRLLAQVQATQARLARIPDIIKLFRQSVLAAAVSGKLTEEWQHNSSNKLVNNNEIAHQHRIYFHSQGRKYKEPLSINDFSGLPAIPKNWRWYRAEQLCDLITKGTTPSSEQMSASDEIPYIKVYNLTFNGSLDFSINPTFINRQTHENELKRSKVLPGDVLMNIVGPPLGKVSIVPDTYSEWNINQAICLFRPVCGVSEFYLSLCLRDDNLLSLTKMKAKATAGQFNLTLEICRDYPIPVPSPEEQTEIVRRVEQLFAYADSIEQQAKAAKERVDNLTQAILAKAFRGELTADWRAANPDLISGDNSAEALLARIQAERAQSGKKSRKRTQPAP